MPAPTPASSVRVGCTRDRLQVQVVEWFSAAGTRGCCAAASNRATMRAQFPIQCGHVYAGAALWGGVGACEEVRMSVCV